MKQLTHFEKRLENGPKSKMLTIIGVIFVISMSFGYVMSLTVKTFAQQTLHQKQVEIEKLASQRMNERIEEYQKVRLQ